MNNTIKREREAPLSWYTPRMLALNPLPSGIQPDAVFKALLFEVADKRPRGGTRLSSCPYHLSDDGAKIEINF